jgi:hypothetical protein
MTYNTRTNVYEGSAMMKMGYYNYAYVTVNSNDPGARASFEFTEGNHYETENNYDILVYYHALGGRSDQLVGMYSLNSMNNLR